MNLILLGLLAGLDNVQVAAALGVAGLAPRRRALLAAMFALTESLSPILGVVLADQLGTRLGFSFAGIGPYVVLGCGAAIVLLALFGGDDADDNAAKRLANSRWTLFGLPLSLSIDNVFVGISAGTLGYPPLLAAAAIGGISALLCVAGIAFGDRLHRLVPRRPELVSGGALIAIAASMWIRN
ncbi:MAG TPA: manganese efflux pump [Thermoanaerobaculia bacterium]